MNPDQKLLDRIARQPGIPLALDTSALFISLNAELVAFDREAGVVVIDYQPGAAFYQGGGVVQGGVVGTMLDYAMGMVVLGRLEEGLLPATTTFTVNLIAPVRDQKVRVEATIQHAGRRSAFVDARLRILAVDGSAGGIAATASSTVTIIESRPG